MIKANRNGMTLVELLVVLVILASLAVTVSVSSSGMIDRARVEKARRQGESMRDALTREDGLNLACDMGRMPNPAQPGELALLVSRAFRGDVQHKNGESGPLDADTAADGALQFAPNYRQYRMLDLKRSITNKVPEYAVLDNLMKHATVSNLWSAASVGGGWRGPYCTACSQDDDNWQLPDPFGGLWDFANDGDMMTLTCYGSDQLAETDPDADINDWRTADIHFPVCPTNDTASLHVKWVLPGDMTSSTGAVFVCCLSPRLSTAHERDADGFCMMTPAAFASASGLSGADGITVEGLSPGNWGVFVGIDSGKDGVYSAPIGVVPIQKGRKSVKFILSKCD